MAVFYKHIKGTTNATSNADGLWTWLKWSSETAPTSLNTDAKFLPHIHINNKNEDPAASNDLGYIITNNAMNQTINYFITCTNGIQTPSIQQTSFIRIKDNISDSFSIYRQKTDGSHHNFMICSGVEGSSLITTYSAKHDIHGNVQLNNNLTVTNNYYSEKGHIILGEKPSTEQEGSYVQAVYFNATSDKRAKENINPLLTNALDIIKKIKVYTFNLKSQPEERMIGVIAQEFLDKKLDGVSLVANRDATGENGDYMSIRESKLIYLLLKGMQEQQEQIEQLQKRITELESK